jgi:uncharacterized protein (TIGR02118 family)
VRFWHRDSPRPNLEGGLCEGTAAATGGARLNKIHARLAKTGVAFDSMEAIGAAFGSKEGQATAADLANFAQAGVQMLMFDTRSI